MTAFQRGSQSKSFGYLYKTKTILLYNGYPVFYHRDLIITFVNCRAFECFLFKLFFFTKIQRLRTYRNRPYENVVCSRNGWVHLWTYVSMAAQSKLALYGNFIPFYRDIKLDTFILHWQCMLRLGRVQLKCTWNKVLILT